MIYKHFKLNILNLNPLTKISKMSQENLLLAVRQNIDSIKPLDYDHPEY